MQTEQYGPEDGDDLVLILGWGNRLDHENVQWLIDQLTEAGYQVDAFELPTVIDDFYEEYLEPVEEYVADLDSFRIVGHSTGGLIAAYVEGAETETYLSPWWGFRESDLPAGDLLLDLVGQLPTDQAIVPKEHWEHDELGALVTEEEIAAVPERLAPTFIREARDAQAHRPSIAADAVVFCTLEEEIVSLSAIGAGVPADRTVLYDGGHELFSSRSRDDHLDTLLAVIEDGAGALD